MAAQSLKWKSDGKMKAYGVIEIAPIIAMNCVSFSPSDRETTETKMLRKALFVFLDHCL